MTIKKKIKSQKKRKHLEFKKKLKKLRLRTWAC